MERPPPNPPEFFGPFRWTANQVFRCKIWKNSSLEQLIFLLIQSDLFGMAKWPFSMVKWPPTRGWKGHFESPGFSSLLGLLICVSLFFSFLILFPFFADRSILQYWPGAFRRGKTHCSSLPICGLVRFLLLCGSLKDVSCSPVLGEMIQFDYVTIFFKLVGTADELFVEMFDIAWIIWYFKFL